MSSVEIAVKTRRPFVLDSGGYSMDPNMCRREIACVARGVESLLGHER